MEGLQYNSSTHPCPWCNAKKKNNLEIRGETRTIGKITQMYQKWVNETNSNIHRAKLYG